MSDFDNDSFSFEHSKEIDYSDMQDFHTSLEPAAFALNSTSKDLVIEEFKHQENQKLEAFAGHVIQHIVKQLSLIYLRKKRLSQRSALLRWRSLSLKRISKTTAGFLVRKYIKILALVMKKAIQKSLRCSLTRWAFQASEMKKEEFVYKIRMKYQEEHDESLIKLNQQVTALLSKEAYLEEQCLIQASKNNRLRLAFKKQIKNSSVYKELQEVTHTNELLKEKIQRLKENIGGFVGDMNHLIDPDDDGKEDLT